MTPHPRHLLRTLAALAAVLVLALAAGCGGDDDSGDDSGGSGTEASASLTPCNVDGKQQDLGASYVTSIEVDGVSCSKAEQVVKAYHQCRQQNGGPGGTCDTEVQGFACTESNKQEVPDVQLNADVDCTGEAGEIRSSYTQNF